MTDANRTRQDIYARLQEVGREGFILEEMIRYGFWPARGELPQDPAEEIHRRSEIREQLAKLYQENTRLHNEKALRRQLFQQRLEESRRKRQETKERRERERLEKAQAWEQQKNQDLVYLGEGVSGGLNNKEGNQERLQEAGLPILTTALEVATALGITIGQLRFLAFNRPTSSLSHYIRFKIPKKTGGERLISAPKPRLKGVQHWILESILAKIPVADVVHGFCHDRSILTNARPHVGAEVVINCDLKDFFPSISYRRIKGLFRSFGYNEAVATILALLTTEADTEVVELDGKTYYVALGDRHLPQGSPASPALSNILCRRLDQRLETMAKELGFTYTRYADDLTFSASGENLQYIRKVIARTESIVTHEGLTIHPEKTRIMRRKSSQVEVTGVVINEFPNLDKKTLKRFRALLFQIERDGLTGKHWGNSPDLLASIQGYANFVSSIVPAKGAEFQEKIRQIRAKWRSNS